MPGDVSFLRLRIHELKGRILARRQLAEQSPERTWHLDYIETYEAELRQLQSQLQGKEAAASGHRSPVPQVMASARPG
jgi:hypothetical protein